MRFSSFFWSLLLKAAKILGPGNIRSVLLRVFPLKPDLNLMPDKQLICKVRGGIEKHEAGISQRKLLNRPI